MRARSNLSDGFKGNATYLFRAVVDFLFRRRLPGLWLIRAGLGLLALLLVSLSIGVTIPTENGPLVFSFSTEGTAETIVNGAFGLAALLILAGLGWTWRDRQALDRKRVIAIEIRGLRDTSGQPLSGAVPPTIEGRRDLLLINLRQGQDGKISAPDAALREIQSLPYDLKRREGGLDREDIAYVMGGLAPVPFSFLVGVLTDDEGAVTLMDWNRHSQYWRSLDEPDDGKRFQIDGLDGVPAGVPEAALAVSVSYAVDLAGVSAKFPNVPVVQMTLEDGTPDSHWSEEKQQALAQQFLETAIVLGNKGVGQIHLFLAAPNSVVLRFGRAYDKRNLPRLTVYQYEQDQAPPFPWGVQMPVANASDAELIT